MKLALEKVRDINVLIASGEISTENFAVLRAGIKKLFREGKNKIVLELPNASGFPTEILRELAQLNLTAAELSGQIVLTGLDSGVRAKIGAFAKPPVVHTFETRAQAIEFFHPPIVEQELKAPPPPAAAAPAAQAPAGPTDPSQYKDAIRARELGELGTLRKKLSDSEAQNRELRDQLSALIVARRSPPNESAARTQIELLEKELDEALNTIQGAKDAKK